MPPEGRPIGPIVLRLSTAPLEGAARKRQAAGVGDGLEELDEPDEPDESEEPDVEEEVELEEPLSLEPDVLPDDSLFEPFWLRLSVR
jgi:hypothetical protein